MDSNSRRRLPVPPLRQTLDNYLTSLDPFFRQDEACGGPSRDVELSKHSQLALKFENEIGTILQERLCALDHISPYNWLDDNFWMKAAYLQSRASVMVNSNWWCLYHPDPSIPAMPRPENGQYTFWQVRRAAWLVHKMLEYRAQLENQGHRGSASLDMPFPMPFHRCRIPGEFCDTLAPLPTRGTVGSRKIILMLHDWFYALEVLDEADAAIPVANIESLIWQAIRDATSRRSHGEHPASIGVLTTQNREAWYKIRNHLLHLSSRNRVTLKAIEESIFILSLDDYTLMPEGKSTPVRDADLDAHVRNASTGIAGHNRWFDKCVSIFVESNARACGMGEHSPCDGIVVATMMNQSLVDNIDSRQFGRTTIPPEPSSTDTQAVHGWERLDWDVDDEVTNQCLIAERWARSISDNSDASMLWFNDYGARWIKNTAKMSPDAYVQMTMQLAWYRAHGTFTAIYETASTHKFTHGRTETVRSFSTESWRFVKVMEDPQCSTATRMKRLEEAVRKHNVTTREATNGQGIDRHLLGLQLVMQEGEDSLLFRDPMFERSQTWKLSTSGGVIGGGRGERFLGTGFGSPLDDGYGVQYILDQEVLKFGVESKRSCPTTSTERFKVALLQSLIDMRDLCERGLHTKPAGRL